MAQGAIDYFQCARSLAMLLSAKVIADLALTVEMLGYPRGRYRTEEVELVWGITAKLSRSEHRNERSEEARERQRGREALSRRQAATICCPWIEI